MYAPRYTAKALLGADIALYRKQGRLRTRSPLAHDFAEAIQQFWLRK